LPLLHVGSCKDDLRNNEHIGYLRTVFERIADHPINRIDELLPWRLMPAAHIEQQAA
jgi:transposase